MLYLALSNCRVVSDDFDSPITQGLDSAVTQVDVRADEPAEREHTRGNPRDLAFPGWEPRLGLESLLQFTI
jgi:hypothetical protein